MRKLSVLLLFVLALGFGTALAQTDQTVVVVDQDLTDPVIDTYWIGLSAGFPLGAAVHFGINDLLSNSIDVRFNASFANDISLGANAIFDFGVNMEAPLEIYAGVGPTLFIGGDSGFGISAFAGAEYRFTELGFQPGGAFAEIGPFIGFDRNPGLIARVGFNYHF